jgi:hypothetical protein
MNDPDDESRFAELARVGPYAPRLGAALITLAEPHIGHERAYNRWYEDDHFITGAMAYPHLFAGRRWVATVAHQQARRPAVSPIAQPIDVGKYLSTYWIVEGQREAWASWGRSTNDRLATDGRIFAARTNVHATIPRYLGPIYRDADGPRDLHALDHPYGGLVLEIVDLARPGDPEAAFAWLRAERVPVPGSPVAMGTVFGSGTSVGTPTGTSIGVASAERGRLTILWFTEHDPLERWDEFAGVVDRWSTSGVGELAFLAPFIPTVPGTDRYVDELRA